MYIAHASTPFDSLEHSHAKPSGTEIEKIDEDVLDEGCYYLSKLGLGPKDIATRFELTKADVVKRSERFETRLKTGEVVEDMGLDFWQSIREEAEGNVKVNFVSGKGFHHAWRSDLAKFDGSTLLSIFESCKDFLNLDPNARFLQYDAPKNYDPLAMQREVSKAVVVIGALLEEKWKKEKKGKKGKGKRVKQ
jgi:hypothetical protein